MTHLPRDVTAQEVSDVFSRCGVIAEEIDRGKPRIKLYTDESGNFKGDALIVYFRAESVDLAIQMLDDTDFRLGRPAPTGKMKVTVADFSYKNQKDAPVKSNPKDKKKIIKKTQKLNKYGTSDCFVDLVGLTWRNKVNWRIGTMTTHLLFKTRARNGTKSLS